MSELCLIHGIPLKYDMRSGFELCCECEKDIPQPAPHPSYADLVAKFPEWQGKTVGEICAEIVANLAPTECPDCSYDSQPAPELLREDELANPADLKMFSQLIPFVKMLQARLREARADYASEVIVSDDLQKQAAAYQEDAENLLAELEQANKQIEVLRHNARLL